MDSITQGFLGATVAECGFRHKLGRGATLMGGLCGVLPDLDIILGRIDPWWTWQYHRHFTHSIFFAPLAALPIAALFWRWRGRGQFWLWCLCAYLALATHPLLDLLTSYGTQLLAPVSDVRLGLDWIAIIDPIYSLILLLTLLGCVLFRRLGRSATTWRIGAAGMVLSIAYLAYGAANHSTAMSRIRRHAQTSGHRILAARAIPQIGSVYVWRLIYRTPRGDYVGRTNTRFDGTPKFRFLPKSDHPFIAVADALPRIELFRRFTMGWARPVVGGGPRGIRIRYDDLRYSWPPDEPKSLWCAVVDFDLDGNVVDVWRGSNRGVKRGGASQVWQQFWHELATP
jgi:inner membrane protein